MLLLHLRAVGLLGGSSGVLADLLLLLVVSLLSASVVSSLGSASLVLVVGLSILLLILRIRINIQFILPLAALITAMDVPMGSSDVVATSILDRHLGAAAASAGCCVQSLPTLAVVILSI